MWMSQNYINSDEEGRECFETLAMRSFFQILEKNSFDVSIKHCKMQDVVHDFALFLAKNEFVAMEVGKWRPLDERSRHLTFVVVPGAQYPTPSCNKLDQENLRSLFIASSSCFIDCSSFLHIKYLRTLTMARCQLRKLPESISKLIHLRYRDLRHNLLVELPEALCDLCNLQTLNLSRCFSLQRLPKGIGKLVNLRHLYISDCCVSMDLPKGIGRLTCLQRLDTLAISDNEEAYFGIRDLKRLKNLQLRGECVCVNGCRNLGTASEAEKLGLRNSRDTVELSLSFGNFENWFGNEDDSEVLEGLEPHQGLKRLRITCYSGTTVSPRWMMSLDNLREIYLHHCFNCEILPSLGKMPNLVSISISGMKSLKKVGLEFLGLTTREEEEDSSTKKLDKPLKSPLTVSFPKLESLSFEWLDEWETWEASSASATEAGLITIMPCLRSLKLYQCPRLGALPDFLETTTSLKELTIMMCEILVGWCRNQAGKDWAKISHVPKILLNWKYIRVDGVWIEEEEEEDFFSWEKSE